jgi:hypothetical protein
VPESSDERPQRSTTIPTASTGDRNSTSAEPLDAPGEDDVRISITIGEQQFTATLAESSAAADLVAQLPVTIDMVDHGSVEKTGLLPEPLSLDGQPDGADPEVGDIGYYAPR